MKYLISFLMLCNISFAAEFSMGTVVNMHLTKENLSPLKNKITDNGKFVSSPVFLQMTFKNISVFNTTECMGQITTGVYYSSKITERETWKLSTTVGAYVIQTKKWRESMRQYWLDVSDTYGIVPIISLKFNKTLYKHNDYKFESVTNLTPAMAQTGIFLTVEF